MNSSAGRTASAFRDLHVPGKPFILANVWDRGSARMMAAMGAQAVATSSAAHAFTMGVPDSGRVTLDAALTHAEDIVSAVNIPVSGDFENGFADAPDRLADNVRLAARVGLAGISIEDIVPMVGSAYDFDLAVERIHAAASAARALPHDFVLVARADGVMTGAYDMAEGLRRIRAFDEAGADCLYIPMPPSLADVAATIKATSKPVNVLIAGPYARESLATYATMGAARLSLGSALARATHRVLFDAGEAMFDDGDFTALTKGISSKDIDALLDKGAS
ncbi:MAG: isocitrate lyase/phosphoenolpyruvate mutase family protein [Deltaproteobacteria bacterium]